MSKANTAAPREQDVNKTTTPEYLFPTIALFLLFLKILALFFLHDLPLIGDENDYLGNSENFFENYWVLPDFWAPLQTAFLALVRIFAGEHLILTARLIQLLAHTATGFFIYWLGRDLMSQRLGLAAGVLFLVLPETVSYAYLLFSETWSNFWIMGSLYFYFKKSSVNRTHSIFIAGLFYGVACLFRAVNFYFFPLFAAHIFIFSDLRPVGRLVASLAFVVALLLPVSVQTLKNYGVFGAFVPIDTCGAFNIWASHNTFAPPNWNYKGSGNFEESKMRGIPAGARPFCIGPHPGKKARMELREAFKFIRQNPGLTAKRTVKKIRALFAPTIYFFKSLKLSQEGSFVGKWLDTPGFRGVVSFTYMTMMVFSVVGLLFWNEWKFKSISLLLIAYHISICGFFFGLTRFRMPFTGLLIIFAAWSLLHFRDVRHIKIGPRHYLAGLIIVALISGWALQYFQVLRGH